MPLRAGLVFMAPDGDLKRHRASVKTPTLELATVLFELMDFDQAIDVCKDLGDVPSTMMAGEMLAKEGWFSEEH